MSHHDKELYPDHNTDSIHAEMALHGLTFTRPSMMSDAFRFGYVAAMQQQSKADLLTHLREVLELDLSNADEVRTMIDHLSVTSDPITHSDLCMSSCGEPCDCIIPGDNQ